HRTIFNKRAVNDQLVGGDAVIVLGISHGAFERLGQQTGRLARDERDVIEGLGDATALDEARDFANLLGRHMRVASESLNFHFDVPVGPRPQISLRVIPPWPLKTRVGANSPSLWPTMFSVMYTGMNLFPLCTASVCPMNSGEIVDARAQVLMTRFSPRAFIDRKSVV